MSLPQRDYRKLAAALAPDIPDAELEKVVQALEGLETVFRPLTSEIGDETEPAYTLTLPAEWTA